MRKFIYQNDNGQMHIEAADMDLTQTAAEIGNIAHEIYNGLHRSDPNAADIFKTAVIMVMAHPDSPTWTIKEQSEEGITIVQLGKKSK